MILTYIALCSLAAFALFGWDKACAKAGRARVPEMVLLGVCFLGGTAGGFMAIRFFRHKSSKTSFQVKLWLVMALQIFLIATMPDAIQRQIYRIMQ